jgi:hypothetical protein
VKKSELVKVVLLPNSYPQPMTSLGEIRENPGLSIE